AEALSLSKDRDAEKNLALLKTYSDRPPQNKPRRIVFKFLASPLEIKGDGRVESVVIGRNVLVKREDGSRVAKPTGETEEIPCGLVFRSVGYRGVALPGVPFDERSAVIPNREGRVVSVPDGEAVVGLYTVGWI